MKLKIKIDPTYSTPKTRKPSPHEIIRGLSYGITTGVRRGYHSGEFAYGFVYHKVNRKVKSTKRVKKVWEGKEVWTNKRTYEPAKWVVSYYKIPLNILKFMKLELRQGVRSFKLIKSK